MAKRKTKSNHDVTATGGEEAMSKDLTQYVATKQAAERSGVVTEHVNDLLVAGKLKGTKFGNSWMVYVPSIDKYLETKSVAGRPPSRSQQSEQAS